MIVRARGAIWLNPFASVLFSVCSAVTVECSVLYPCCMGVFCYLGLYSVCYYVRKHTLVISVDPHFHACLEVSFHALK